MISILLNDDALHGLALFHRLRVVALENLEVSATLDNEFEFWRLSDNLHLRRSRI